MDCLSADTDQKRTNKSPHKNIHDKMHLPLQLMSRNLTPITVSLLLPPSSDPATNVRRFPQILACLLAYLLNSGQHKSRKCCASAVDLHNSNRSSKSFLRKINYARFALAQTDSIRSISKSLPAQPTYRYVSSVPVQLLANDQGHSWLQFVSCFYGTKLCLYFLW